MHANFFRHQYKHRFAVPRRKPCPEYHLPIKERLYTIGLRHRRADSLFSFYDNNEQDDNELATSKWTIVRQRLPDILALSTTYKPSSIRAQLSLLVALMNKQTRQLHELSNSDDDHNQSRVATNVIVNIGGRNRLIYLKRIPPEQMIYVDVDDLSFSVPTRQFIMAISRGDAHQTAAKYCPPAMSDMLIDLSKTKVVDEGKQYKRALFKMLIGQLLFFALFIFISGMILALIVSSSDALSKLNSFNHTSPNISIIPSSSNIQTEE